LESVNFVADYSFSEPAIVYNQDGSVNVVYLLHVFKSLT
jgi:hypothetical protein